VKWLQDNPVGMVLASVCGIFVLLALVMAVVWNLPVSVDTAGVESETADGGQVSLAAHEIGSITEFQVINEKPVFNESRQPVTDEIVDEDQVEDMTLIVRDAPDVKLTGVVITPSARLASLTPANQKIEAVMAREGDSLTGEFVGWRLATVHPRGVVLESRDGRSLELELQVHDAKIAEPPKVEAAPPLDPALTGQGEEPANDEEPMSRAEQIRQRIAERREELRREQEEQAQAEDQVDTASQPARPPSYQSAIRSLMNNKSKDQDSNDKEDG